MKQRSRFANRKDWRPLIKHKRIPTGAAFIVKWRESLQIADGLLSRQRCGCDISMTLRKRSSSLGSAR